MTGQLKATDGSSAAPSITFSNEATTGFSRVSAGVIGVDILGTQIGTISATGIVIPTQGTVPIGTVVDFAGSTAPAQWYLCYGQAVSRTTYASLFAAIGTTYGVGDGSTTFNLPDLRGRVGAGQDNMGGSAANRLTTAGGGIDGVTLGAVGGGQNATILQANLPAATLTTTITDPGHGHTTNGAVAGGSGIQTTGGSQNTVSAGAVANSNTTGITASTALGGSGTAFKLVQPAIIVNKIIYAGA